MKIVTFNLRCVWLMPEKDNINSFQFRAGMILDTIDEKHPDVMFFQEATEKISGFLSKHLYGYEFHYNGRNDDRGGEGLAFAYDKAKLDLISTDCFWLSPTPDIPGTRFEHQSDCPRIAVHTVMREKATGKVFRVFNVHLDHLDDEARLEGIKLVLARIKEANERFDMPTVLLGDFNAFPTDAPIMYINDFAGYRMTDITKDIDYTFHDYGKVKEKIDYIYVDEKTAETASGINKWKENACGIYLSDHYPVEAEIGIGR